MNIKNLTWLGFLMMLSSLSMATTTLAIDTNVKSADVSKNIETRLNRISEALKTRQQNLSKNIQNYPENEILLGGFINGGGGWRNISGGGGFINNRGGGGFINNRGWGDGGGFLNRR
ncbi:GrrA/OscA1 family cyclophane-containing rSAM-modified RiPP [Geminocystis sp. GBBB08]|uniref:GrrA/OscA1 family cyclophane-containing rSAM-modified RiPP n=1 Tax=Geminocystis sp. GBBB08 TaxID=2604140 RepID=UPI0027E33E19|nr:GrrA/OscA1 family cyclophane-containing rSAM-modified RiPP [Geminocystis sp. GBBB08]MBL1208213.1 rSAM-associated Gly-rich repeat protein [Geminocystis sp. GBBB08]